MIHVEKCNRRRVLVGTLLVPVLSVASPALGESGSTYHPGLDVGASGQTATVEYAKPGGGGCGETCHDDLMQGGPTVALLFQKPFSPAWHWGILFADYGFGMGLKHFSLTNDPAKNGISMRESVSGPDGSITTVTLAPDHSLKFDIWGVNPLFFVQTGLAIPYLPYLVLTLGGGYQYNYGSLKLDGVSQNVQGGSPALLAGVEVIFMRFSHLWTSFYLTASPTTGAMTMKAQPDEPSSYRMQFWQTQLGVKAYLR